MRTCTLTYMHPHIHERIYLHTTYTHLHIKERLSSLPFKDSQSSKMEKEKYLIVIENLSGWQSWC